MKRHSVFGSLTLLIACLLLSGAVLAEQVSLSVGLRGDPAIWEELLVDFHAKHPNIRIDRVVQVDWNMEAVVLNHISGNPLDVVYTVIEQAWAMVDQGLVRPLDEFVERDTSPEFQSFLDDVHPNLMETWRSNGTQYYLPFEWNNMVMYFNPVLFDDRGLTHPQAGWTWDDFLANAQGLSYDRNGDGTFDVYGYAGAWPGPFGIAPWIYTAGGRILNDDWTESRLNDPRVVEAIEFLQSLKFEYDVAPREGAYIDTENQVGMWGAGRWPVLHYQNVAFYNYDIQLWPQYREQTTVLGGGAHGISSVSAHPEEAWTFIKWVNSPEVVAYWTRRGDSNPSLRSVAMSDAVLGVPPPSAHLYYEALNHIEPVPSPPQFPELDRIMIEQLGRAINDGDVAPQIAVEEAHRLVNAMLRGESVE